MTLPAAPCYGYSYSNWLSTAPCYPCAPWHVAELLQRGMPPSLIAASSSSAQELHIKGSAVRQGVEASDAWPLGYVLQIGCPPYCSGT